MAVRIIVRRDTVANWTAANPVLALGELAITQLEGGLLELKIGNGSSAWVDLVPVASSSVVSSVAAAAAAAEAASAAAAAAQQALADFLAHEPGGGGGTGPVGPIEVADITDAGESGQALVKAATVGEALAVLSLENVQADLDSRAQVIGEGRIRFWPSAPSLPDAELGMLNDIFFQTPATPTP